MGIVEKMQLCAMARIDRKLEHILLQHEITEILRNDNGVSAHFDYHVNLLSSDETVKLNLLTFNPRHSEYMLLHTTTGSSSIDCLKKMMDYLRGSHSAKTKYSFTVKWRKKGEEAFIHSYFMASDNQEAEQKFLHEKSKDEYEYQIEQNPLA
jgi:hypothetical protein